MTKNLRKRHLQIWIAGSFVFPLAIIIAWTSVVHPPKQSSVLSKDGISLPVIIKQWEKKDYRVTIQGDSSGRICQLEWIKKSALRVPAATIHLAGSGDFITDQSILIGRIETGDIQYFPLEARLIKKQGSFTRLILYDFIHQQIMDSLKLYP